MHWIKFLTLESIFLLLHDDTWCTYEKIKTKMQQIIQQSIQMPLKRVGHVKDKNYSSSKT